MNSLAHTRLTRSSRSEASSFPGLGPELQVWQPVLAELQESVQKPSFDTYLAGTEARLVRRTLTVSCPNAFVAETLDRRFHSVISQAAAKVLGRVVKVVFVHPDPPDKPPPRRRAGRGHYLYTLHHPGVRNGAALFVALVLEILSVVDTPRAERQATRLKMDFRLSNPTARGRARRFYSWLRGEHGRRALGCAR